MNKRFVLFHFLLFVGLICWSQSLETINTKRLNSNKSGMVVLGTWALINLASSPILSARSEGSMKAFHQMNGYWNTVNLALAGIGYYTALTTDPTGFTLNETIKAQHSMEKILLFNAGLDLAYMVGGMYLQQRARSSSKHRDRLKGFGKSLILQGAFLFVFDLGFYLVKAKQSNALLAFVDHLAIAPNGIQLSFYL